MLQNIQTYFKLLACFYSFCSTLINFLPLIKRIPQFLIKGKKRTKFQLVKPGAQLFISPLFFKVMDILWIVSLTKNQHELNKIVFPL